MSAESNTPAAPLDWLSGRPIRNQDPNDEVGSIVTCQDVVFLLQGIDKYLDEKISEKNATKRAETSKKDKQIDDDKDSLSKELTKGEGDEIEEHGKTNGTREDLSCEKQHEKRNEATDSIDDNKRSTFASNVSRLRELLYEERRRTSPPIVAEAIVESTNEENLRFLVPKLLENLYYLPFETRKDIAAVFNYLLVCAIEDGSQVDEVSCVENAISYQTIMVNFQNYILSNFDTIVIRIVNGFNIALKYNTPDIALHCGSMYRSLCKHVALYQQLVSTTERVQAYVFPFLDVYVQTPNFDVSSDAMECIRVVFTGASASGNAFNSSGNAGGNAGQCQYLDEQTQQYFLQITAEFLLRDYDAIWEQRFNPKLLTKSTSKDISTNNYMTRRMALQILSSILLTRSNYGVMIKYVSSKRNLRLIMFLLRDTSPHITLDAFNVFKVFVANPNKPEEITKILSDNKVKLCRYLQTLHYEREVTDIQFREEKRLIISTISYL